MLCGTISGSYFTQKTNKQTNKNTIHVMSLIYIFGENDYYFTAYNFLLNRLQSLEKLFLAMLKHTSADHLFSVHVNTTFRFTNGMNSVRLKQKLCM